MSSALRFFGVVFMISLRFANERKLAIANQNNLESEVIRVGNTVNI